MAVEIYSSANYAALEMRGGGMLLRHLNSRAEVFFQPGDDAATFRDTIEALEEVPERRRDTVFDIACGQYI